MEVYSSLSSLETGCLDTKGGQYWELVEDGLLGLGLDVNVTKMNAIEMLIYEMQC